MTLAELIERHLQTFAPMFQPALSADNTIYMELSDTGRFSGMSEAEIDAAVFHEIAAAGAIAGVGGYLENRSIYADTDLFQGDAERCIHIGVDVFLPADTPIYAPLDGEVQSFANRAVAGDYGPVIILRHRLQDFDFHSLYGHLSESSLDGLYEGKTFARGEQVAAVGPRPVNGNWTPHLHFQLIRDMQGIKGDYPGVVRPSDLDFYRENCPDPNALIIT